MIPSQLRKFLDRAIPAGRPVLITSGPGLGKSEIVGQAADGASADLLTTVAVVSDPTDAKGFPTISDDKKSADFVPFGDLKQAVTATKPLVWFLDDLGQAAPAVQASYMQLILARRINGHPIPDCVTFIAATNRRTDGAGVSGILEPVKSRFASIVSLEPNLDDWCDWATTHSIRPEIIAFLRFKTEQLYKFERKADIVNQPCPRTWKHASDVLELGFPKEEKEIEAEALVGAVGEGAAGEFAAYLRMYRELPNIDLILKDPDAGAIPRESNVLYAIVTTLAMRATSQNFAKIARYSERLADAELGEYSVVLVRDATRRDKKLQETDAFVKLLTKTEVGRLLSGRG